MDSTEAVRELLHLMIRRGLVIRADRLHKKPKPGHKRLSKWPRKLAVVHMNDQVSLSRDLPPRDDYTITQGCRDCRPWEMSRSLCLTCAEVGGGCVLYVDVRASHISLVLRGRRRTCRPGAYAVSLPSGSVPGEESLGPRSLKSEL